VIGWEWTETTFNLSHYNQYTYVHLDKIKENYNYIITNVYVTKEWYFLNSIYIIYKRKESWFFFYKSLNILKIFYLINLFIFYDKKLPNKKLIPIFFFLFFSKVVQHILKSLKLHKHIKHQWTFLVLLFSLFSIYLLTFIFWNIYKYKI